MPTKPDPSTMRGRGAASKRAQGFTMVELLTTLVVLAVLLAIAAPGLGTFVNNSRLRSTQGELLSSFTLARSEATKRGTFVAVGALAPVAGNEFGGGWRVFVDANGNDTFDADETEVRTYPALTGGQRFGTDGTTVVTFNSRGFLKSGALLPFQLCGQPGYRKGYLIRLEPVGLADLSEKEDLCT